MWIHLLFMWEDCKIYSDNLKVIQFIIGWGTTKNLKNKNNERDSCRDHLVLTHFSQLCPFFFNGPFFVSCSTPKKQMGLTCQNRTHKDLMSGSGWVDSPLHADCADCTYLVNFITLSLSLSFFFLTKLVISYLLHSVHAWMR